MISYPGTEGLQPPLGYKKQNYYIKLPNNYVKKHLNRITGVQRLANAKIRIVQAALILLLKALCDAAQSHTLVGNISPGVPLWLPGRGQNLLGDLTGMGTPGQ